jgi:pimeloyl-ACP methyl ester carboxylesterase
MIFFSGFCFEGEEELFKSFTCKGEFCVVGFSYGAIKALNYALHVKTRIDKIQLISPAFFQDKDEKFKRLQKISFQKNPEKYIQNFIQNVQFPNSLELKKFLHVGMFEELEELLDYEYKEEELVFLKNKNIKIEVYLGQKDKIIDTKKTKEFFLPFATVYLFKDAGHLLQITHN